MFLENKQNCNNCEYLGNCIYTNSTEVNNIHLKAMRSSFKSGNINWCQSYWPTQKKKINQVIEEKKSIDQWFK